MNKIYVIFLFLVLFLFTACSIKKESVVVSNEGNYSVYNGSNEKTNKNSYTEISSLNSVDEENIKTEHLHFINFHWLHNSYGNLFSIVKKDNKYGIINDKYEYLINPEYDLITTVYNGFFIIKKDDKYGYINDEFKIVQEPLYNDVKEFSNDVAFVKFSNNKWGCISSKMKVLLEGKFDFIFPLINSYSRIMNDDKWGFINNKCEVVVAPKYDYVSDFYADFTKVILDNKVGYINKNGEEVAKPNFTYGQNFNE